IVVIFFQIIDLFIVVSIVDFGSSLPVFIISFWGALKGNSGVSVGNIIGSNLFNTLVIVGASALASPIMIKASSVKKKIPFALLASLAFIFLCFDRLLNNQAIDFISRGDRSEEHTSELQSRFDLVCRLLLEKKK